MVSSDRMIGAQHQLVLTCSRRLTGCLRSLASFAALRRSRISDSSTGLPCKHLTVRANAWQPAGGSDCINNKIEQAGAAILHELGPACEERFAGYAALLYGQVAGLRSMRTRTSGKVILTRKSGIVILLRQCALIRHVCNVEITELHSEGKCWLMEKVGCKKAWPLQCAVHIVNRLKVRYVS